MSVVPPVVGAFVSSTLNPMTTKVASLVTEELTLLLGVEKEMKSLSRTLDMIRAVLEDAERKQFSDERVHTWLVHLKEIAFDAADVLDEFDTEAQRHSQGQTGRDCGILPRSCYTFPCMLSFHYSIAHRIKDTQMELDKVIKEQTFANLQALGSGASQDETSSWRETSYIPDDNVFGREKDIEEIKQKLLVFEDNVHTHGGNDNNGKVSLVPIVGMAGIGKTTLAQAVYNDEDIRRCFPARRWLFVGEDFNAKRLINEILKEEKLDVRLSLVDFHTKLVNVLREQRFLIVLDDVWTERIAEWEQLWRPLSQTRKGGKVIVTTRSESVANTMASTSFELLQRLSDDHCWSIFEKRAFVGGDSDAKPELKEIGLEIVKKFKGIPLAAKIVGSALRNKDVNSWVALLESRAWLLTQDEGDQACILPILELSYRHLPSHLKRCFTYCSVFPKDYEFDRDNMVQLWMAQGFIEPRGDKRMEDIGIDYFDNLLQRSFLQCIDNSYVMHDLIHDLAQLVAKGECLRFERREPYRKQENICHLSLCADGAEPMDFKNVGQFEKLHSVVYIRGRLSNTSSRVLSRVFGRLKRIRALNLSRSFIDELPKSIGNLKHLRYLDLTNTWVDTLPESLCFLCNLQTLKVNEGCPLPKGMSRLVNLRHLRAGDVYISEISGTGKLICLQELKALSVYKEEGHKIEELKGMTQLRGRLCIQNLDEVGSIQEAVDVNLKDKVLLGGLELRWSAREADDRTPLDQTHEGVLEALQPHRGIKELKVCGHRGTAPPSWLMQEGDPQLPHLVSVALSNCKRWALLPPLKRLRSLRRLTMSGMDGVKQVGPEFLCRHGNRSSGNGSSPQDEEAVAFPFASLEELVLEHMVGWEAWVGAGEECKVGREEERRHGRCCLPRLRKVCISKCPRITSLSALLQHHHLNVLESLTVFSCAKLGWLWETTCKEGEPLFLAESPRLPGRHLGRLEKLHIYNCEELPWLQLQPLLLLASSSLTQLEVKGCPKLSLELSPQEQQRVLPMSSSSSAQPWQRLEFLRTDAQLLLSWVLSWRLENLTTLALVNCDDGELTAFTDEAVWQSHLPSLQELTIGECPNLQSLPPHLQSLPCLQQLSIFSCPHIQALPERGLPRSLQELVISGCPSLEHRCRRDGGLDWPKIAHIQNVHYMRVHGRGVLHQPPSHH